MNDTAGVVIALVVTALSVWLRWRQQRLGLVAQAKTAEYILYGFIGFGIGVVAAGFLSVYLLNTDTFTQMQEQMRLYMPLFAVVGIALGLLYAYIRPIAFITEEQAQAQQQLRQQQLQVAESKVSPAKAAFLRGIVYAGIGAVMLTLNYFFGIFNNIVNQYTGVQTPSWLLFWVFVCSLAIGIGDLLYALFLSVRRRPAPETQTAQPIESSTNS